MKTQYGDNIYHIDPDGEWIQENSHHSLENGVVNFKNYDTDLKSKNVLISERFYYFGRNAPAIPENILENANIPSKGFRHHRVVNDDAIIDWIIDNFEPGYYGDPIEFDKNFTRFPGV